MKQRKVILSVLFGAFCLTLHKTWSEEPVVLTPVPGYSLPSAIQIVVPSEFNPEELPSALDYARTITPDAIESGKVAEAPVIEKAAPKVATVKMGKRKSVAKFKAKMKKHAASVSMKAGSGYSKAARGARKAS